MSRVAAIVLVVGCGRFEFDPLRDSGTGSDTSNTVADAPMNEPSLLVWLPLDGTIADASEYSRSSQCMQFECPVFIGDGARGMAARFDGMDDAVRVIYQPDLEAAALTIAVWARRATDFIGVPQSIVSQAFGENAQNSWEILVNLTPQIAAGGDSVANTYTYSPWAAGSWQHIAFTWDGANGRAYVGGGETDGPVAIGILYDGNDIIIGGDENGGGLSSFWEGDLDDVRVYNRVLSAAEIAALAAL